LQNKDNNVDKFDKKKSVNSHIFFSIFIFEVMENSSLSTASEYRPQEFKDVIGQDAIVKTLSNAIENQNIPQALLFCGPRGVGKTSCARILAKKINNLTENYEYNIFELDAASNNSVEDIRNITDQIRIPPQFGKYKVYIIDEVHMLSNAAFNAFLKSLEEPPKHVVFILATTEKNKIIPTILSRCQIYDFKKVDNNSIVGLLSKICSEKDIKYDQNSLMLIAEKSDGSIRDSLSIFDRLVSFTNSNLNIVEVTSNLNIIDFDVYFKLSELINQKNIPEILYLYNDIYAKGFDDLNFLNGLLRHLRELLLNKFDIQISNVKGDLLKKYSELSSIFSDEDLIYMIDIINDSVINYQKVNDKRIHTEICLIKLASIESLKKKNSLISTSYSKSQSKKDDQSLDEILEVKDDKLFEVKPLEEVSLLSIASIEFKKTTAIKNYTDNKELPSDNFTENDLLKAWNKFCKIEKNSGNNNMLSLLNMGNPIIENNTIRIATVNEMNLKELNSYKSNIETFISKELNNFSINVEVFLSKSQSKKTYYDSHQKLEFIKKSNKNISKLIEEFKLRI